MPPTLKLVISWSDHRNLCDVVGQAIQAVAANEDIKQLGDDAHAVYTNASAEEIRDAIKPLLHEGEGLLVAEFERWSSYGSAVDAAWLLRRGH